MYALTQTLKLNVMLNQNVAQPVIFYAVKEGAKGETPYVFERIADRNAWMERYETAKPSCITSIYTATIQ